jgi:hypothetical protein
MSLIYACNCNAVAATPSRKRRQPWVHVSCALLLCCKLAESLHLPIVTTSSTQSPWCSSRSRSSSSLRSATHRHAHRLCHSSKQLQQIRMSSSVDSASGSTKRSSKKKKAKVPVHTLAEMDKLLQAGTPLFNLDVRGDSYEHLIGRPEADMHPVLEILRQRRESGSKPGERSDAFKVHTCQHCAQTFAASSVQRTYSVNAHCILYCLAYKLL